MDHRLNAIERLLQGSIDMHVHHGPDARVDRRVDALQVARQAREAGMRAVVLKSRDYPTAPLAYIVSQVVQDITVFGSVTLDYAVGGLNTAALETSARLGAKVVWMPTFSSAYEMRGKNVAGEGITILDADRKLFPVVGEILDIVKNYRMVLATGHLSVRETFALVEEAAKRGVSKIVITHPLREVGGISFSLEEQRRLAEKGAYIEHCFLMTMPLTEGRRHPEEIAKAVKAVGAERCILTTDFGQAYNPAPAEGMRMMIATMLKSGLTEKEMELMIKLNPARLLDLD